MNAAQLRDHAAHFKIDFRPGSLFSSLGGFEDFIRISYVFYEPEDLELGVMRLRQAIEEMHLKKP